MQANYNTDAPKKPVNLTLNSDLLKLSKDMGLNLSSLAEEAIAQAVRTRLAEAWLHENAEAIQAYNSRIEAHGVFSDGLRSF
ncbi:MAG: type II toxin-antitoxin system CcdA family antitoxin [Holophagaceae bacterium]|nr:type II toxin-antitoxin system CcdA family antitoxin [Holophagaceae bacterium]